MVDRLKASFLVLVVLLVSCSKDNITSIRVDPEKGTYWLNAGEQFLGPIRLVVNGTQALKDLSFPGGR